MNNIITKHLHRTVALFAAVIILTSALSTAGPVRSRSALSRATWPDLIPIPVGLEAEGIELGKGQDFFVGAMTFSGNTTHAGTIYKGNLATGEGEILVEATGKSVAGLSYDVRTDYLYAATGSSGGFGGPFWGQGVKVYTGTSGLLVGEIIFGDGTEMVINDVLVTDKAVYCTDSINAVLYKIPLANGGKVFSSVVEKIELTGFEMVEGYNANGLVGSFDGKELVIVNIRTGALYLVDTESGDSFPVDIQGDEQLFPKGDGLFMQGRTLYICQNSHNRIAVVQLSDDLTQGTFVKSIVSDNFAIPTTIIGFGRSIYAINTHYMELISGGDPTLVQSEVVRVDK